MLVYIAGPMRDHDCFNFPAFFDAERRAVGYGYDCLNPARHDNECGFDETLNSLDGFNMHEAFRWDVESVLKAGAVFVLPGWQKSSGVAIEVSVAHAIGTPVYEFIPVGHDDFNLDLVRP